MKKILFTITIVLLLAAFGISAFLVGSYLMEGKEQEENYNNLASIAAAGQSETRENAPAETDETEETTELTEPTMIPGYAEIYEMNDDTVGWIKIEGTKLDYPVMQTPDEANYYLYRDFYGQESTRGSIYAREECDINEPSDNITLYGHNMMDGSMFAGLHKYAEKEKWDENSLIIFNTLYEYHTYKIFAVFKTTATVGRGFSYHQFVDAVTEEEFNKYVDTCKDLAFYETGITPVYGDKLIALSTCEYSDPNGRLVVAAVRIS